MYISCGVAGCIHISAYIPFIPYFYKNAKKYENSPTFLNNMLLI